MASTRYSKDQSAVLHFKIVHTIENETIIKTASMKASVGMKVLTLRTFMAQQVNLSKSTCSSIKLLFRQENMKDSLTLYQHGIVDLAQITVLLPELPKKKLSKKDLKSTGSKRRRDEDDMSIASKRTKYDDNMSVSTMARDDVSVVMEQRFHDRKNTKTFQGWAKSCTIQSGTLIGGKDQNEDAVFTYQSDDGRVSAVGVFDGHGQQSFAAVSSKFSKKVTKAWFTRFEAEMTKWTPEIWKEKFDSLFAKLHQLVRDQFEKMEQHIRKTSGITLEKQVVDVVDKKGVVRKSNGAPIHGGTTASICVVIRKSSGEQYLVTAYVGDSDVIIARKGTTVNFELVTEGHRALNKREYSRIKELPEELYPVKLDLVYDVHGVTDPRLLPHVYTKTGEMDSKVAAHPLLYGLYSSNIRKEPATYAVTPASVKKDRVRLANTRAIGDFYAEQFGVSHTPEVLMEHLPPNESFFIIAGSDGVWDTWEYHEVVSWANDITKAGPLEGMHVEDFLHATRSYSHKVYGTMAAVDDSSLCVICAPSHSTATTKTCY
jgi:serine/threonine protein phosphatase PrpC